MYYSIALLIMPLFPATFIEQIYVLKAQYQHMKWVMFTVFTSLYPVDKKTLGNAQRTEKTDNYSLLWFHRDEAI